ncbi:leucyl aminopeptidase [Enterobacteriaceae endosymbiont of Macroplea appendiculata]|uniref:leucyl aminopeptidase n=1 Tax=Enterobacteriaceae endosymbiont of Macroplea appendiculata TaxID=2675790 RepID=UPI001448AE3F|nr:leucyl aminopeptidase [Enterobacteriaceae endosymbiont of Macroplea appendiculata]QJC30774.1 leucyl aminopeptidase [Enterobacteriaceae endosymbiont of Macroplea appendiculata]
MQFFVENNFDAAKYFDCIVLGIYHKYIMPDITKKINDISENYILTILKDNNFYGKTNQMITLYNVPNVLTKKIIIIGCGFVKKINRTVYHKIIINIIQYVKQHDIQEIFWSITDLHIHNNNYYWNIRDIINIIGDNTYIFTKFKQIKKCYLTKNFFYISSISDNNVYNALKHGVAINQGQIQAKNLANLPPNICNPKYLAEQVFKLSQIFPDKFTIEIVDENMMEKLSMNAYLSVSNGSKHKAYMSVIKYNHHHSMQPIVLVGKGLTFDSGGISLKPSLNMHEMKYDMCGAAAVYGVMYAIAKLELPLNVIGIMAGCENMPGSLALRPGDVIKTMSGITVEVKNTDAEGRLVLCDVLTYILKYKPKIVIDIATLTGACVIALGNNISGLMSNNNQLSRDIYQASIEVMNDKVWDLPLEDFYHDKQLHSSIADISNISINNAGSAITAACFLAKFTSQYKWAHIDIAGTAWNYDKDNQAIATGRPVNMLCQFLINNIHFKK